MPDIKKYKSVAVPIDTWEKLWEIAQDNHRSPSQQISFFVARANSGTTKDEPKAA